MAYVHIKNLKKLGQHVEAGTEKEITFFAPVYFKENGLLGQYMLYRGKYYAKVVAVLEQKGRRCKLLVKWVEEGFRRLISPSEEVVICGDMTFIYHYERVPGLFP